MILLIIPGIIPGVVSVADGQLGDSGNSGSLILEEISTDPKYPKPNSVVAINAIVKNTGNAASNPTSITYTRTYALERAKTSYPLKYKYK